MSLPVRPSFRALFLDHYDGFRRRLQRRLGSDDLAVDALQETWFRVERMREGNASTSRNPVGYLFRMALNVAADQRQASSRLLTGLEIDALLDESSPAMDPAASALGQMEVEQLGEALAQLPARQREILLAARLDEIPLADIARQHGISERMVGKELKCALHACGRHLERDVVQRFGPGAGNRS